MPPAKRWLLGRDRAIDLTTPQLMGVINLTPDSFHSPSRAIDAQTSVAMTYRMAIEEGATIVDVGAESTRPGASRVDSDTQIARLEALFEEAKEHDGLGFHLGWHLSVDTTLAHVARHAVRNGAHAINDVSAALEDPAILPLAAELGCGLILMHRALPPDRDAYSDQYAAAPMTGDVVTQVRDFLLARALAAIDAGVDHERICLDPGFGFGKTVEQNLELARRIDQIVDLGFPVLVGVSRKSFIGRLSHPDRDTTPDERLPGTLAISLALADRGVRLFRVHDVAEHAAAFRVWESTRRL